MKRKPKARLLIQIVYVKDDRKLCDENNSLKAYTVIDLNMRALSEWGSAIMFDPQTMQIDTPRATK